MSINIHLDLKRQKIDITIPNSFEFNNSKPRNKTQEIKRCQDQIETWKRNGLFRRKSKEQIPHYFTHDIRTNDKHFSYSDSSKLYRNFIRNNNRIPKETPKSDTRTLDERVNSALVGDFSQDILISDSTHDSNITVEQLDRELAEYMAGW